MSPWVAKRIAKLEKLSMRERWVVGVCACAVAWFLIDTLLVTPAESERRTLEQLISTQREELNQANAQMESVTSGEMARGDPAMLARLAQIDKDTLSVDASLRASQQYLVPPERMGALLQDILRRDKRLELVALQTLPVAPIVASTAAESAPVATPPAADAGKTKDNAVEASMFRHGVQIVVRGNYLDVMAYLQEVEKLPWQMYWGRLTMDARGTGQPVFVISLYTLSLDQSWLVI